LSCNVVIAGVPRRESKLHRQQAHRDLLPRGPFLLSL
jgi:hypothetical protein